MNQKGFTLVEIMVTSVIMSVIGGMILVMTQTSNQVWNRADMRLSATSSAHIAINRLTEDLHRASQSAIACLPFTASTTDDQLIFSTVPLANNNKITYAVNAEGQLTRAVGTVIPNVTGAPSAVASNITVFTPTCQSNGVVDLVIVSQVAADQNGDMAQRLASHVWVKNP